MQTGVATVVFEKIDTKEIRVMPCTLNEEVAQVGTISAMMLKVHH